MDYDKICAVCGYRYGLHSVSDDLCPEFIDGYTTPLYEKSTTTFTPKDNTVKTTEQKIEELQKQLDELKKEIQTEMTVGQVCVHDNRRLRWIYSITSNVYYVVQHRSCFSSHSVAMDWFVRKYAHKLIASDVSPFKGLSCNQ